MIWDILTPDDFAGDWYGWLTNQAAHFILGGALQLLFGLWWVPAYLAVEVAHYAVGGTVIDGVTDTLFVGCGAAVAYALRLDRDTKAVTAFSLFIVALALGVLG